MFGFSWVKDNEVEKLMKKRDTTLGDVLDRSDLPDFLRDPGATAINTIAEFGAKNLDELIRIAVTELDEPTASAEPHRATKHPRVATDLLLIVASHSNYTEQVLVEVLRAVSVLGGRHVLHSVAGQNIADIVLAAATKSPQSTREAIAAILEQEELHHTLLRFIAECAPIGEMFLSLVGVTSDAAMSPANFEHSISPTCSEQIIDGLIAKRFPRRFAEYCRIAIAKPHAYSYFRVWNQVCVNAPNQVTGRFAEALLEKETATLFIRAVVDATKEEASREASGIANTTSDVAANSAGGVATAAMSAFSPLLAQAISSLETLTTLVQSASFAVPMSEAEYEAPANKVNDVAATLIDVAQDLVPIVAAALVQAAPVAAPPPLPVAESPSSEAASNPAPPAPRRPRLGAVRRALIEYFVAFYRIRRADVDERLNELGAFHVLVRLATAFPNDTSVVRWLDEVASDAALSWFNPLFRMLVYGPSHMLHHCYSWTTEPSFTHTSLRAIAHKTVFSLSGLLVTDDFARLGSEEVVAESDARSWPSPSELLDFLQSETASWRVETKRHGNPITGANFMELGSGGGLPVNHHEQVRPEQSESNLSDPFESLILSPQIPAGGFPKVVLRPPREEGYRSQVWHTYEESDDPPQAATDGTAQKKKPFSDELWPTTSVRKASGTDDDDAVIFEVAESRPGLSDGARSPDSVTFSSTKTQLDTDEVRVEDDDGEAVDDAWKRRGDDDAAAAPSTFKSLESWGAGDQFEGAGEFRTVQIADVGSGGTAASVGPPAREDVVVLPREAARSSGMSDAAPAVRGSSAASSANGSSSSAPGNPNRYKLPDLSKDDDDDW